MKKKIITLGLLFFLSNATIAQENKGMDIPIYLYAFDYAQGHQNVFLVNKKGDATEVRLSTANIVGPNKTTMDENRVVRLHSKEISSEGEVLYTAIAEIKIPLGAKDPLLVLMPQKEINNKLYRAFVINRDMDGFPNGSYKIINFSNRNVRGIVGGTRIAAAAKKITLFSVAENAETKLIVQFQYQRDKDWKTFAHTSWIKEPEKRSLLFIYQDPISQRMCMRGIPVREPNKIPSNN